MRNELLIWYEQNKRDLPWRRTVDPYEIWVSEVILQQTRVNQGIEYYFRFLSRFPSVCALAEASEEEVLRQWQGLGYYSRARNMLVASKQIVNDFSGVFPQDYESLLLIKGIGPYTAAAISSFAFNKPAPAIDGNVYRFLSRYYGITHAVSSIAGRKCAEEVVRGLIPENRAGDFAQALIEFGALQCVPKSPKCDLCIFNMSCFALAHGRQNQLPIRNKSKLPKERIFNYAVIYHDSVVDDRCFRIKKRTNAKDIWRNLYDFPVIETAEKMNPEQFQDAFSKEGIIANAEPYELSPTPYYMVHKLTHQTIHAFFWSIEINESVEIPQTIAVYGNSIDQYPLPRLIENFFNVAESTFSFPGK